jgi:amino acid transporter, AAT family
MRSSFKYLRVFRFAQLFAIAVGGTISSTYFLGNSLLFHQLGPFAFLAFIIGGLITYFSMNAMAELAGNEQPTHLSFIKYSYDYVSPSVSCAVGYSYWINWLIYIPTECIAGGFFLNAIFPKIPIILFALLIALAITYFNLKKTSAFATSAEWFTYTHLCFFALFIILALLVFLGFAGNQKEFLGLKYLVPSSGIFPNGWKVFLFNGLILILNFQGAEIIGLSASETRHPKQETPKTIKEMAPSITLLYTLPMLLLGLIYPWDNPPVEGSIFATSLESYGFKDLGRIFAFLIFCGSVAVSNSGLYAASRASHALAHFKMLPKHFLHLSDNHIPKRLVVLSSLLVVSVLLMGFFFEVTKYYQVLLLLSGFSGCVAWIFICVSQLKKRYLMKKNETNLLRYKDLFYPLGSLIAIILMITSFFALLLEPDLRTSFYLGSLTFVIPFISYKLKEIWQRSK